MRIPADRNGLRTRKRTLHLRQMFDLKKVKISGKKSGVGNQDGNLNDRTGWEMGQVSVLPGDILWKPRAFELTQN